MSTKEEVMKSYPEKYLSYENQVIIQVLEDSLKIASNSLKATKSPNFFIEEYYLVDENTFMEGEVVDTLPEISKARSSCNIIRLIINMEIEGSLPIQSVYNVPSDVSSQIDQYWTGLLKLHLAHLVEISSNAVNYKKVSLN